MKKQAILGRTSPLPASIYDVDVLKSGDYACAVEAVPETIEKSEFLVVYIYTAKKIQKGDTQAVTRTFLDRTNYITQDLESQEPKWLTATLGNLLHTHAPCGKKIYVSDETRELVAEFFGKRPDEDYALGPIHAFQEEYLSLKMAKKDNAIKDAADRVMGIVQETPEDFVQWIEDSALLKSRYIFYKYTGKVKVQGYCTHCKQGVEIRKPKHNMVTECPNCNSQVTLKTEARSTKVEDETVVTLLEYHQPTRRLILRTFEVSKKYGREYRTPRLTISERHRAINPMKECEDNYSYGRFKSRIHDVRWNKVLDTCTRSSTIYPHNLHELQELPELKYSGVQELAMSTPDVRFNIRKLMSNTLNGDHVVEKLAKVGLYKMATEYLETRILHHYHGGAILETDATTLNDLLQVENDDAKLLINANVGLTGLMIFSHFRHHGKRLSSEELEIIDKLKIQKHHLVDRGITNYVPIAKALKYLDKVYKKTGKNPTTSYRDYLGMCHELDMDMKSAKTLFPEHLTDSHDIVVGIMNIRKGEIEAKRAAKEFAQIEERSVENGAFYNYVGKKYTIRSANSAVEILNEGNSLNHCVGSKTYLSKVAKGDIAILFLRKREEPDVSFFTVEMRGQQIIQCRTQGNKGVERSDLRTFLDEWKEELDRREKMQQSA